jgi:hypothetical protein
MNRCFISNNGVFPPLAMARTNRSILSRFSIDSIESELEQRSSPQRKRASGCLRETDRCRPILQGWGEVRRFLCASLFIGREISR